MSKTLDKLDLRILNELQKDGRLTNVALAKRVNLTPSPCLERVRRLERDGYITGYAALLNPRKLGMGLLAFVEVELDRASEDVFTHFRNSVKDLPQVIECSMIAGGFDYLLKVRFRDMADYRDFLGSVVTRLPGVKSTHTYVCMEEVKSGTRFDLGLG